MGRDISRRRESVNVQGLTLNLEKLLGGKLKALLKKKTEDNKLNGRFTYVILNQQPSLFYSYIIAIYPNEISYLDSDFLFTER